ncbi:hypothetical protein IW262DRAFT_1291677 [Armillaria fumosa]|nr:hypothetical protein IW262DRAFT_1291677 [Armillaria fumosa]
MNIRKSIMITIGSSSESDQSVALQSLKQGPADWYLKSLHGGHFEEIKDIARNAIARSMVTDSDSLFFVIYILEPRMQILPDLPESWSKEFQQLLKSNGLPTKTQVMAIQPMLSHAMENMAIIIRAAERLQDMIDDCKAIISPMHRVPPEILREVFFWINVDRAPVDVFSMTSIPYTLGLALALSDGQRLSIRCSLDPDGLLEIEKEIQTIQDQWPIPTKSTIAAALNREVLRLRESQRWNDACFRIDDYAYLPILNDARGKVDQLMTLSFGMIPVAPQQRNVELSRMGHVEPHLPEQQLISVRDEWYSRDGLDLDGRLQRLCRMPNLGGYDLDGFEYKLNNHAPIQHSALRVLHAYAPGIFTSLELSNLEEVYLKAAPFDDTCRFTTLTNFLV